jgi:phosphatidylglycerophosphatase A
LCALSPDHCRAALPDILMTRLALLLSTFGYAGYSPIAPGTAGSAAGLIVYALLRWSGSPVAEACVIVALTIAGVWSATRAEEYFGRQDPGEVVIDEVVGMLVTLAFLPTSWTAAVVGFFLFRLSDIIKPYPARDFERLPGGWGIMADDVMAAIYANLVLRAALWIGPRILA